MVHLNLCIYHLLCTACLVGPTSAISGGCQKWKVPFNCNTAEQFCDGVQAVVTWSLGKYSKPSRLVTLIHMRNERYLLGLENAGGRLTKWSTVRLSHSFYALLRDWDIGNYKQYVYYTLLLIKTWCWTITFWSQWTRYQPLWAIQILSGLTKLKLDLKCVRLQTDLKWR